MLDLVPLARARREMTHLNFQPCLVAERLQFNFPKAIAATIAATAVGRDQQALGLRVPAAAQLLPPGPNGLDGDLGRVATYPDADPCFVMGQIIDPVGNCLPFAWIGKIVNIHFAWPALGLPLRAWILQISHGFLLLCIDRDRRL